MVQIIELLLLSQRPVRCLNMPDTLVHFKDMCTDVIFLPCSRSLRFQTKGRYYCSELQPFQQSR